MFEHLNHKKYNFSVASRKTVVMSRAAFRGECDGLSALLARPAGPSPRGSREYVALVPFFGGLPPDVTADLAVKSIGQGNSLVDSSTKALQAMATVCSCIRYFGRVVVGPFACSIISYINTYIHTYTVNAHVHMHMARRVCALYYCMQCSMLIIACEVNTFDFT